jgi:hypothetical protein
VSDDKSTITELEVEEGEHHLRMGSAFSGGRGSSGETRGPSGKEIEGGLPEPSRHPEENEHPLQHRSRKRVSTPSRVDQLEAGLRQAFEAGSPEEAWRISQALVILARGAVIEAAQARFKANFGTEQCLTCEGLQVRPGVVATCAQMKKCYYTSLKGDPDKLSTVAETLTGRET